MNLDHLPDVTVTRLLWREQVAALPRALWHAVLRALRSEPRYYLTISDQVAARFVSPQDHLELLTWLAETHKANADYNFALGKEHLIARLILQEAQATDTDAGAPSPS
jgi:hypothetical protein